jgi:hypothetical protein
MRQAGSTVDVEHRERIREAWWNVEAADGTGELRGV